MILYINTGRMRFAIDLSILIIVMLRSSPSKVFLGKGVQKICSNFTGEHPVPKLLCNFIEIALRHVCSLVNMLHIFRILFLKNCFWILLSEYFQSKNRSSHLGCPVRKGVLTNFAKFTGKKLYQSLFVNKSAGLGPATLLKRDPGKGFFLWILRNF